MANIKWIKLNVDMFDDEKIKLIQALPEGDSLLLVWIKLILLAGKTNEGGYVYINENMAYTDEMLSVIMNKPLNIIRLALETFKNLQMIETDEKGIYLVNFEKHQSLDKMQEIREYNRLAQQKHRLKLKCQKMSLTSQESQDIEEDIDKDIDYIKENKKKSIDDNLLMYEQNFGTLSPTTAEIIISLEEEYSKKYVKEAFKRAIENNKKSLAYVKGILKQWKDKSWEQILSEGKKVDPTWLGKEIKKGVLTEEESKELDNLLKEFE